MLRISVFKLRDSENVSYAEYIIQKIKKLKIKIARGWIKNTQNFTDECEQIICCYYLVFIYVWSLRLLLDIYSKLYL